MIADPPIGEDDLNAFVDGRLAPERHALVGRFLADNSSLGERVAADIAARNGLRESLQFKAAEPNSARLRIANLAVERRRAPRRWLQVAAAIVLVALAGIGGWFAHGRFGATSIAQGEAPIAAEALRAHRIYTVETVHPVEVAAAQEAHLVQWLSRRLNYPLLKAPDLSAQGFHLMGGRLLPASSGAAAQLMYQDDGGARLTVYLRADGEGGQRFALSKAKMRPHFSGRKMDSAMRLPPARSPAIADHCGIRLSAVEILGADATSAAYVS